MKCHMCSSKMEAIITDLPFKVSHTTIVILKGLPVFQCVSCREYLLDDSVMEQVENIIEHIDNSAELEVLKYAA
ncbi:MAG: YgiT-type zinc finger protein [Desulfobacterales bacterium]|nr:YgiT-type zinc finger protein [Desulfobacterales bacterium]